MSGTSHYTFGDGTVAGDRLALLAECYEEPSQEFLRAHARAGLSLAVDLGSGVGYTTALVHRVAGAQHTIGLERSSRYLARARQSCPSGISFVEHDLAGSAAPIPPADLLFVRFLLTHLPEPSRALHHWLALARPGALLLVQEVAGLRSEHPALQRYYQLVEAMQRHYGQALYIGQNLEALGRETSWKYRSFGLRHVSRPAATMARLHLMNLMTWQDDAFARQHFDAAELSELSAALERVARGEEASSPVETALGELVLEAPGPEGSD